MAREVRRILGSCSFELNTNDWVRILVQALLVGLAALITYLIDAVSGGSLDAGQYKLIVMAVLTTLLHAVRRWYNDYSNSPFPEND